MTEILKAHDFELALAPEAGGEVLWLTWQGEALLRAAPKSAHEVRDSAAFPLVPFSGRITDGRFTFGAADYRLPPNMPPERHAIHGHGWQSAWHVAAREPDAITLVYRHPRGAWDWAYRAEQVFRITQAALEIEQRVTNLSERTMPAGLGWHPYFARSDAELMCDVTGFWASADVFEPLSAQTDLTQTRRVAEMTLDNAFRGGGGPARIYWPSRQLEIEIDPSTEYTHWIVYVPAGADFFCVEPVSHAPNVINMRAAPDSAAMRLLETGETFTAKCTLRPSRR